MTHELQSGDCNNDTVPSYTFLVSITLFTVLNDDIYLVFFKFLFNADKLHLR